MTFLGNGLSIIALLFFGALIAGSQMYARVEIHERQAMGIQKPGEVN
jgi:hypothetical protein